MADLLDTMEKITGITREESLKIWEQVKANHKKLAECEGPHDFTIEARKVGTLVREWGCTKCGGTVESTHRAWYLDGLRHGSR